MGPVRRAESVHHINVAQARQLRGQSRIVLFLALEKTHVFQQHALARRRFGLGRIPDQRHVPAQQFTQARGHGLE